ncbi:MAG: SEL1-like repeat protein [candidate division Zixibacteria bacterium]|nr:SEL1-like repeat protein [candidate division Zixibacteria bacterium]
MTKPTRALIIISIALICPVACPVADSIDLEPIVRRAESGDAYYQGVLGAIYRRGETGETNYEKAYQWLKLSSDNGNPIGLYNLAALYESGKFVGKDTALANTLYAQAYEPMLQLALQGDPVAQVNLGYLLEIGAGVDADLQEALRWYEKAAKANYPRAQFILGYKHYHGWGYEKDYGKAIDWFTRAAKRGYGAAQHRLGNMYANGIGVAASYDDAVGFFREAEQSQNSREAIGADSVQYVLNGIAYDGDKIIPGLLPPEFKYDIPEGSCGEACLWSVINANGFVTSQIEINNDGGYPGRGLHSNELHRPLDKHNIVYVDHMTRSYFDYAISFLNPVNYLSSHSEEYREFLYDVVIEKIKQGTPIILGLKIYPDRHFFWDCDHFILLVGYNEETNEIIYNDFDRRGRISADKLLDQSDGYSIINRYNFLNYIEIENPSRHLSEPQ